MKIITLDFESFWSQTHSLTKMQPMTYVMHPETEIISCSIKIDDGPTRCVFGEDKIAKLFERIDWTDAMVVAHNMSEFDSMILAWRFGVKPKMWCCTLAMARPIYAKTVGLSLAKLGAHLCPELGEKGSLEATNTKGKHLKDFTPEETKSMGVYNNQDTEICYGIFKKLAKLTPPDEFRQIDATIRMLVEPKFELDAPLLTSTLAEEKKKKHMMLLDVATMVGAYEAGMTDEEAATAASKVLASAPKFSELLRMLNVEVPMKPSPSDPESGKMIPALAKTDQEFLDLQEHDDPIVAMAASARLGVKSTLLETRIEKFLEAGEQCGGLLPIPTRYYGADTTGRRCLAEGTRILVRDSDGAVYETPIELVTTDHEVWDGVDWVNHDGVEFSGDKEVIEWDGVVATAEHIVWIDVDTKVQLGYARANKLTLWGGNDIPNI